MLPNNIYDLEKDKFCETESGETAVRVCLDDSQIGFLKYEITIGANATVVADVNLLTSFSRLDYILNFKDSPVTVTKSLKLAVQNSGGSLTDTVSERLGGAINILINVTDDSVDAFLEITNNESFPLTMTYLKSKI